MYDYLCNLSSKIRALFWFGDPKKVICCHRMSVTQNFILLFFLGGGGEPIRGALSNF